MVALSVVPLGFLLDLGPMPELVESHPWWLAVGVLGGAVLGAPVFVAMAGLGMLFYFADDTPGIPPGFNCIFMCWTLLDLHFCFLDLVGPAF